MTKEALKLALEALEICEKDGYIPVRLTRESITVIKEALAQPDQNLNCKSVQARLATAWGYVKPEQEPVAWLHTKIEGVAVPHRPADLDKHPDRWEALYKAPPPCPTCEALARTVMLDQTYHDNISPQRTWVGLTDEETETLIHRFDGDPHTLLDEVNARLKEKNT